nr:hypothetical protein [Streptomyces antibioticus]
MIRSGLSIALIGVLLLQERLDLAGVSRIAMIIVGVVVLNLRETH